MKRLSIYILAGTALLSTACSDFLDTAPHDALSPATTWKTEADAESFVVGCYNGLWDPSAILYLDCGSDIGYNNFPWEGWRPWGDGSASSSSTGKGFYSFTNIRRCNTVMENIDNVEFKTDGKKEDLIAQAKAIRAYAYFRMNWWYGGVPVIGSYQTAEEAQVARDTEEAVRQQIAKDLDEAIAGINVAPSSLGRIAKGGVLAIKMREALYYEEWQKARDAAKAIIDLDQYELESDYAELFKLSGVSSKEVILSDQRIANTLGLSVIGQMYNNQDGGWSSIVPTQNLVDMYEMTDGKTKEESALYDPARPFSNRDPRMAMTILYPGQEWRGDILNTLDENLPNGSRNINYPTYTDNASKTSLTWAKYLDPIDQYPNMWNTGACVIVFRYAEVLLTLAEASNELSGPSDDVYTCLDQIRTRVGMPAVDRAKYNTKESLRELIRRERCVELAGEGLRRADILRWKDAGGKMLAETLMNGQLARIKGHIDYDDKSPSKRGVVDTDRVYIETRQFAAKNRYQPIPQSSIDKNPNLKQNPGY